MKKTRDLLGQSASRGEADRFDELAWIALDPLAGWRMEGEDDGDDGGEGGQGDSDDDDDDDAPKFSQKDLNAIAAREKRDGRRAAEQAVADKLGVSIDEAVQILKDHREAEQKKKDDLTRAEEEANAAKAEKERAEQDAADAKLEARLVKALARFSPSEKTFDDALTVLRSRIQDPSELDDDELKDLVKTLKKDIPSFFGSAGSDGGGGRGGPSGDPGSPPAGGQGKATSLDRGRERARARLGTDKQKE